MCLNKLLTYGKKRDRIYNEKHSEYVYRGIFGGCDTDIMIKKIIVASSKGGVGKTTVALGIASALTMRGKRALLCDLDFENRSLDLFMGIENLPLHNLADVAYDRATPEKALLRNGKGLSFVPAPTGHENETDALKGYLPASIIYALKAVIDYEEPDFVIFDTSAGLCVPVLLAKNFVGSLAVTVASHQPASCRGAERAASVLLENGARDASLVITQFDSFASLRDARSGLLQIIDSSSAKLLGVVPFDKELMISHERGVMAPADSPSSAAFKNIAARLCSENVKLFSGVRGIKKKNIF